MSLDDVDSLTERTRESMLKVLEKNSIEAKAVMERNRKAKAI
jgi:hypothetical protein